MQAKKGLDNKKFVCFFFLVCFLCFVFFLFFFLFLLGGGLWLLVGFLVGFGCGVLFLLCGVGGGLVFIYPQYLMDHRLITNSLVG